MPIKKTMNIRFISAAAAVFTFAMATAAPGQQLPDSIFDECPPAFGNTINDAPPDIHSVEIIPAEPKAGQPVTVRAVVKTDPVHSIKRVIEALLTYETGGVIEKIPMKLVDAEKRIWEAAIPAQKSGAVVNYGISGRDEIGNAVAQLINFPEGVKNTPALVIEDKEDSEVEGSVDLTGVSFSSDGENLNFCSHLRLPFRWSTFRGAAAVALGFYPDDIRKIPAHSQTENVNAFAAYMPLAEVEGIVRIEAISGKGSSGIKIPFKAKGRRVCGKAPIANLAKDPERGVKMYSGTVTYSMGEDKFFLGDATPYAIIYFKGEQYTVR